MEEYVEAVEDFLIDNYNITKDNYECFHQETERLINQFINEQYDEPIEDYEYLGNTLCSYVEAGLKKLTIL